MNRSRSIVLFLLACLPFVCSGCRPSVPAELVPVRVALPALEQNALIFIAADQNYFRDHGLDVTIEKVDSGVTALKALQENQVELAVAAEFPVVRALMEQQPISITVSIDKFQNDYFIARKDRGIEQITDIKGKRVGLAQKTINEFYLARFLELNGIELAAITQVDLKPAEFVEAIVSGKIDVLLTWQPYISQVQKELQDQVITWPAQSSQPAYGLLAARQPWLAENQPAVLSFHQSLLNAENYLVSNPDGAKKIVQNNLNYELAYLEAVWQDHAFALTLDHSLIVAMRDEARWLIRSGSSSNSIAPEFYDGFYLDALKTIKPEAVTIER